MKTCGITYLIAEIYESCSCLWKSQDANSHTVYSNNINSPQNDKHFASILS